MTVSFGISEASRLTLDAGEDLLVGGLRSCYEGWLSLTVRVAAGGFGGEIRNSVMVAELKAFLTELRRLYKKPTGPAVFETYEGWLPLRLTGDGLGHIVLEGQLVDSLFENRLKFTLHFDQTHLKLSIEELEGVLKGCRRA